MNKIFVLFIALVLGLSACKTGNEKGKEVSVDRRNDLPQMMLTLNGRSPISAKTLEGKSILIFFQPDCDHCQREAKEISDHIDAFETYKVYFISTAQLDAMNQFAKDFKLEGKPNIFIAQTTLDEILSSVGPISAPSMFIYKDQKLVKHLDGETPISEILKYL